MKTTHINRNIVIRQTTQATKPTPAKPYKIDLKNIIEVTEENQTNTNPVEDTNHHPEQPQYHVSRFACIKRCFNCFTYLWRLVTSSSSNLHLNINDEDFTEAITKIMNNKNHCPSVLPAQKQKRKVLVLDLDETLIHTSFTKPFKYDFESQVVFNGHNTKIYTVKRFGLDSFLFQMSKLYEIVVFTASQRIYADRVLNLIDPKKRISHRMYREHCIVVNNSYYLKNLRALGRNMKDVIVVDDNNITGLLQPDNFYKIEPFDGSQKDRYLCRLTDFLKHIHQKRDILPIYQQRKQFEEMEIDLTEEDTASIKPERSIKQRKKNHKHKKSTCDFQAALCRTTSATQSTEEAEESKQGEAEAETTASELIKSM